MRGPLDSRQPDQPEQRRRPERREGEKPERRRPRRRRAHRTTDAPTRVPAPHMHVVGAEKVGQHGLRPAIPRTAAVVEGSKTGLGKCDTRGATAEQRHAGESARAGERVPRPARQDSARGRRWHGRRRPRAPPASAALQDDSQRRRSTPAWGVDHARADLTSERWYQIPNASRIRETCTPTGFAMSTMTAWDGRSRVSIWLPRRAGFMK